MGYTSNRLRVLAVSGKDFQITPREMASIADQLDEKDVELERLKNAARSRLRCPEGHSPSQSRGACWFCDAQRNAEALAATRVAVAAQDIHYHRQGCTLGACNCGADAANAARTEARRAVGLEEGK